MAAAGQLAGHDLRPLTDADHNLAGAVAAGGEKLDDDLEAVTCNLGAQLKNAEADSPATVETPVPYPPFTAGMLTEPVQQLPGRSLAATVENPGGDGDAGQRPGVLHNQRQRRR